jgi:hypothetical protein
MLVRHPGSSNRFDRLSDFWPFMPPLVIFLILDDTWYPPATIEISG